MAGVTSLGLATVVGLTGSITTTHHSSSATSNLDAAPGSAARVVQHAVRRAVSRHDRHLRRNTEVLQDLLTI